MHRSTSDDFSSVSPVGGGPRTFSLTLFCIFVLALSPLAFEPTAFGATKVLMIAGPPSHGYGAHEHYAGLKTLQESVLEATDDFEVEVVRGWPEDASKIETADAVVIYSDGGGRHVAMNHRAEIEELLKRGGGFVALHYAVEMVPGEPGDDWVRLLGGHFEIHYSVNPHW